jgi:Arc/MetJ family transcription regulator
MITTIDLPDALIKAAMKATASKTKKDAITKALTQVVALEQQKKIMAYKGKVDLKINLDILRGRK